MLPSRVVAFAVDGGKFSVQVGVVFATDVHLGIESVDNGTTKIFFELAGCTAVATTSSLAAFTDRLPASVAGDDMAQEIVPMAITIRLYKPLTVRLENPLR